MKLALEAFSNSAKPNLWVPASCGESMNQSHSIPGQALIGGEGLLWHVGHPGGQRIKPSG